MECCGGLPQRLLRQKSLSDRHRKIFACFPHFLGVCMKFTRVLHIFLVCNYILKMEFPCIARQCLIDKPTPPEGHVAVFREMGRFYDSLVCWSKQKWRIFGDGRSLKVARSRELLPNVVLLICLHFERKTSQM